MSTSFARTRGLDAPDSSTFVATVSPLAAGDLVPFEAAAAGGHLVAGRGGTVAALGSAAVLGLPSGLADAGALRAVTTWLRSVERQGSPEPGVPAPEVLAVGAFPFDPSAPATLVVPSRAWCVGADGRGWAIEVRRRGAPRPPGPGRASPGAGRVAAAGPATGSGNGEPGPTGAAAGEVGPRLVEIPAGREYARAVGRILSDIAAGTVRKVVLSRSVDVLLPRAPSPAGVLERLWGGDPAFRPYAVPVEGGRMVGASPELLVDRRGTEVVSHAFAGTVALAGGDEEAVARLLASAKDRDEHRVLVDAIADALGPRCATLDVPPAPNVVRLRSDARLGSLLRGTLVDDDTALELLGLLHPTPAVGGAPRPVALRRIAELEPRRGYWAGAVGWIDAAGDGSWMLAIRSAILEGNRAMVRAGAGVVAGSDPQGELAETTVKLSPVLDALWPGASQLL